jgi:uncharacterized membrane protein
MAKKIVTSARLAKLASKVLKGYEPTADEINSLAACVLRQREKEIETKDEVVLTAATNENVTAVIAPAVVAELAEKGIDVVAEVQAAIDQATSTDVPAETETPAEPVSEKRGFWSNLFVKKD